MLRFSRLALLLLAGVLFYPLGAAAQSAQSGLAHLEDRASTFGLTSADVANAEVTSSYTSQHNGVTHVYLRQRHRGFPVFNAVGAVHMTRDGQVLMMDADFVPELTAKAPAPRPGVAASSAIRYAADALGLQSAPTPTEPEVGFGAGNEAQFAGGTVSRDPIPVRLGYWRRDDGTVALAWQLVLHERDVDADWWEMTVDAASGAVLGQHNYQISHNWHSLFKSKPQPAFSAHWEQAQEGGQSLLAARATGTYRVYVAPTESPNHGERTLVGGAGIADPVASPFGWHDTNGATGAEHTITRGNNVYAYEDRDNDNQPGFSPDGGASLTFDFPLDRTRPPQESQEAIITNLFYWNNVIHDVMYQYGFDEAAGNFQDSNYGRGEASGADDAVNAEAQDGSGTNNANFATPPDGSNPRMQMFLWSPASSVQLTINSPASIAGTEAIAGAGFGGRLTRAGLTADLVLFQDGDTSGDGGTETDGCQAPTNGADMAGKIVIVDRGACNFTLKVKHAQNNGAIAVLIANNNDDPIFGPGGSDPTVTIPSAMIPRQLGAVIKSELTVVGNPVNVTVLDEFEGFTESDSALDNSIIVHEYGHGIHTRLSGGPSNSGCFRLDEQTGEGWADFFALALTQTEGMSGRDPRPIATYSNGESVAGRGIRAQPYSTDFNINGFTYDTIKSARIAEDDNGNPYVVPHDVGQVWAMMMWEVYWELTDKHGFDPDLYNGTGGNNMAIQLAVDGLKLQRCNAGFEDQRDAILAADQANNGGDNECIIWRAFAKRGLGEGADQRSLFQHEDGIEDFSTPASCAAALSADDETETGTFGLDANYPNPFSESTEIRFSLDQAGPAHLAVYDLMGREVATLMDGTLPAGSHETTFSADGLAAGVYLYRLTAGDRTATSRLVVMR